MLEEIAENLKIICNYKINEVSALNALQAKLTQIMAFKGVTFESIENIGRNTPLAYFAFNFVPSGGAKNLLIDVIDLHICKFFDDYINRYNQERLDKLECDWVMKIQQLTDKVEIRRKKMESELEIKKFVKFKKEITTATQAKLYDSLEIIKETQKGAILISNTEFAVYYEDAIINKDKLKKEFLDMLYNLYDGQFQGTDTVSTSRENINGISTSCIFMSDPRLLTDNEKLSGAFKSYLARGMARRCFMYFKKNENYHRGDFQYPTYDEKNLAIEKLTNYSKKIQTIFEQVPEHARYYFNQDANKEINVYKKEVDKRVLEFYKYTNNLNLNQEILKLNVEHSTWKIIKLAVLYHILEDPTSKYVTVANFRKAVKFFNETHKCLEEMLKDNVMSDYDNLYNYLIENRNKFISKTELRNQKFVASREFKSWIEDALNSISEKVENNANFELVTRVTGKRNQGMEIALYEPDVYRFEQVFDGNLQKGKLIKIDNSDLEVSEL